MKDQVCDCARCIGKRNVSAVRMPLFIHEIEKEIILQEKRTKAKTGSN